MKLVPRERFESAGNSSPINTLFKLATSETSCGPSTTATVAAISRSGELKNTAGSPQALRYYIPHPLDRTCRYRSNGTFLADSIGFMFPFRGMPIWAQYFGEALPLTHYLRIVRGLMLKAARFADLRVRDGGLSRSLP